jgi:hypothetical protein
MANSPIGSILVPSFSFFEGSFILGKPFMVVVLVIFFAMYAVYSSVLIYHWSSYGMKNPDIIFAETLFIMVSLSLFIISGTSLFFY